MTERAPARRWLERLEAGEIVLLDGGSGSELERRGVPLDPVAWSAPAAHRHHALLRQIHEDYIAAGAEIITTATFATSRYVLEATGLGAEFETVNRGIVAAALEARHASRRPDVAVAGSMSCLPPRFDAAAYPSGAEELAAYRELAALFAELGVDLLALEMLEDSVHARAALTAALESGMPVAVGVSARVADGRVVAYDFPDTPLAAVLDALLTTPPAVVSVMHTLPEDIPRALDVVRARWRGPLGAYPELPREGGATVAPEHFARLACAWVRHGARLIGGCCGTRPAHIGALRESLPELEAARRLSR